MQKIQNNPNYSPCSNHFGFLYYNNETVLGHNFFGYQI